ncbi:GtrA family protein [Candidatus Mycalebacterium sp.]
MEEVTKNEERLPQWVRHFLKYAVVGAISAVIDLTVFEIVRQILVFGSVAVSLPGGAQFVVTEWFVAKTVSFSVGTIINFFICVGFVFKIRGRSLAVASWRKFLSGAAALVVSLLILWVLVDGFHFGEIERLPFLPFDGIFLANGFSICIGFFLNFVLTKYYAFGDY